MTIGRPLFTHILAALLFALSTGNISARAQADLLACWNEPDEPCLIGTILTIGVVVLSPNVPWPHVPLVPGAGPVQQAEAAPGTACSVTPSTGNGSGVNVRRMPSLDADVIGDIPLGVYREVSAISTEWYQTITRDGSVGFVAANVTALVGACGTIDRFVTTP